MGDWEIHSLSGRLPDNLGEVAYIAWILMELQGSPDSLISGAIAVLFSPVTFAAKVILLYLHLVNKLILKHSDLQLLHLLLTTPMTGVMGYGFK